MTLSIIIVSYNTAVLTQQTLESVVADINQSPKLKGDSEIIVIDNNSTDDSVECIHSFIRSHSDTPINLIINKDNLGFAQANNQGINYSRGEYVLLLNSDTIVHPGALTMLVETFEAHPTDEITAHSGVIHRHTDRLGIIAAQLQNSDGSIQPQGGSFPTLLSLTSHMLMLDDIPLLGKLLPSTQHTGRRFGGSSSSLHTMDWVGGTAMMIRRSVINEIGTLDEAIFMYGEDVEFCLRATSHHWDVALQPQAVVTHLGSSDRAGWSTP